jgi:hypothetical protein
MRAQRSGSYPSIEFRSNDALYFASPTLTYSVVPWEDPSFDEFSEVSWTHVGNIRLWGALAFAIVEGKGFYSFYPLAQRELYVSSLDGGLVHRAAARVAAIKPQSYALHWVKPDVREIAALYQALREADDILLRGVSCYLKSHLLWEHTLFMEEMGVNLHIALEAGLSVLRRRLSHSVGSDVSFQAAYTFVRQTFSHGEALVAFWENCRHHRNILLHPDSHYGAFAMPPMAADDVLELLDPMLSLYRYLLIGEPRPTSF